MLFLDSLLEIVQSLKQHKRRNIITGIGVAWGILILILLQGVGKGLENGMIKSLSIYSQNSLNVYAGLTSITDEYRSSGEPIFFTKDLIRTLKKSFPQIEYISEEVRLGNSVSIIHGRKAQVASIKGIGYDYFHIKYFGLLFGRYFNNSDYSQERNVCIIGFNLYKNLTSNNDIIGKYLNINGDWIKVIGVLKQSNFGSLDEGNTLFVTYPTYQNLYDSRINFTTFGIVLNENFDGELFEKMLRKKMSLLLRFNLNDTSAISINNVSEQVKMFTHLFQMISLFLWFIGVSILLTGVIGVGNMMQVSVKERTKEIGLRKAIGAKSNSILIMIIYESVLITTISGVIGMVSGLFILYLINKALEKFTDPNKFLITSCHVDIPVILGSLFLLILTGIVAGIIPARRAANVMPSIALSHD